MKILALAGPTASGKSEIAIEIAKKINAEIISCDSRLVYKDFNIGTAKPTKEEMQGIMHHLIDVASPQIVYSVSDYINTAQKIIENSSKNLIIIGGTGFYMKALLEGLDIPKVPADEEFRKEMRELAQKKGNDFIYEKLIKIDPKMAEKLHKNDIFRIIRALEVFKNTNELPSLQQKTKEPQFNSIYFGLNAENREYLYNKINKRTHIMIEQGLINEVQGLIDKYGQNLHLLKTLGYQEIVEYLNKENSLEEAISKIQKKTRNYAKRQITWFNANKKIKWYYIDKMDKSEIVEDICLNLIQSS